jgi:hypothetical protein
VADEREVERVFLDVVLSEVAGGQARAVLLTGGAGAGKTWLLARLVDAAVDAGFRVRHGHDAAVGAVVDGRPALVVIDDAGADPPTARLLTRVLGAPPSAPVLIAAALDPRAARRGLRDALRRRDRYGWLSVIELGPAPNAPGHEPRRSPTRRGHGPSAVERSHGWHPLVSPTTRTRPPSPRTTSRST